MKRGRKPGTLSAPGCTKTTEHLKHNKLEPNVVDCADCGEKYPRLVTHSLTVQPKPHWRHKCNCGRTFNPLTNCWEHLTYLEINRAVREHHQKMCLENEQTQGTLE